MKHSGASVESLTQDYLNSLQYPKLEPCPNGVWSIDKQVYELEWRFRVEVATSSFLQVCKYSDSGSPIVKSPEDGTNLAQQGKEHRGAQEYHGIIRSQTVRNFALSVSASIRCTYSVICTAGSDMF